MHRTPPSLTHHHPRPPLRSAALHRTGTDGEHSCFQASDFVGADKFYTQAIIKDPTNAAYFTNRALARVRMAQWEAVVTDCEKAIELLPSSCAPPLPPPLPSPPCIAMD